MNFIKRMIKYYRYGKQWSDFVPVDVSSVNTDQTHLFIITNGDVIDTEFVLKQGTRILIAEARDE